VTVNDRKVDVPSYLVKAGDTVKISSRAESFLQKIRECVESSKERGVPSWLIFDGGNLSGTVKALPLREEMAVPIQEQLVVEFYSK
jgi:small subunit ribosomal protein S4